MEEINDSLNYRINCFEKLFYDLQDTSSRLEKEYLVDTFLKEHPDYKNDWYYILEVIDNKHPLGFKLNEDWQEDMSMRYDAVKNYSTIKEMIEELLIPSKEHDWSVANVDTHIVKIVGYYDFLAPIVNRTLRLGIGKSLLGKTNLSPMLAKKYEGQNLIENVYVTEKLDGNRCIAYYDGEKWCYQSRNGKPMKVDFDMSNLPTDFIFDGEVMSLEQTLASIKRTRPLELTKSVIEDTNNSQILFNKTSGLINSNSTNKNLVYNIFDIIENPAITYKHRRAMLNLLKPTGSNVRILPVLYYGKDINIINGYLDSMTKLGAEGIMLNTEDGSYEHKRTNVLLKYKEVYTLDMRVVSMYEGEGKYEGLCGGIMCEIKKDNGDYISCKIGSGLSDFQRFNWWKKPELIVNKIVEIAYQSLSQDSTIQGSNIYSLRFPRLIRVREDKATTSEY